jgi:3-phosphoshikimate 1-carboxyvinyltransferase
MQKAFITPKKPKAVEIEIPGSKSFTNRALLIASLANGESVLKNPLQSDDTKLTKDALEKLGIEIELENYNFIVKGCGGKFKDPEATLYLGNAGTGLRFLTALLTIAPFKSKITGNKRMKERPINDLLKALKQLGAKIQSTNKNGCPPVKTGQNILKGGTAEISGKVSSQFISALLMVAPYAKNDVTVKITDELISKPYVDMTIQIMEDFGVKVERKNENEFFIKSGQKYKAREYKIEGDASSATYFFALSALHNVPITIKNLTTKTKQADIKFLDALKKMGCKIKSDEKEISVNCENGLKPLGEFDCNHMPDAAMTLAAVSIFAEGKTVLKNIESLRVKETDRIKALTKELKKLGVNAKELEDGIEINGNPKKLIGDCVIETYDDHRMAMCFSCIATKIPKLHILNPSCVTKTYPDFYKHLRQICIPVQIVDLPNVVLTGMRGSGKTKLGKIIANKLDATFIDTDDEIEKQEKSEIPEIIKKKNWFYFRKKEKYIIRKVAKLKNAVISTGGGAIIDKENEKALKKHGTIVFLKYPLHILEDRLKKSKTKRPRLTKNENLKEELEEIWKKRKERYIKSADIVYEAGINLSVEEKAEKIIINI